MTKGKDKDGKAGGRQATSRADAVRAAVEQAFAAGAGGAAGGVGPIRERALELADELAGAASRVREVLDELRPPTVDDLGRLRAQVEALEQRVAELEAAATKPASSRSRAKPPTAAEAKGVSSSPGASTAKRGPAAKRGAAAKKPASES